MQSRDERVAAAAARETATSERILNTENARSVEAVNNFWFESDALGRMAELRWWSILEMVGSQMESQERECSAAMQTASQ